MPLLEINGVGNTKKKIVNETLQGERRNQKNGENQNVRWRIFNFSTFLCEMSMMQTSAFLFGSKKNASKVFLHICNFLSSQRQIFQKFLQNLEFLGIACHSLTTQPSCGEVVFILRYLMSQISAESNVYGWNLVLKYGRFPTVNENYEV